MTTASVPNGWWCRPHQVALWNALAPEDGLRRACEVWHRRAGKDSVALNLTAAKMFQRVGTYWHLLPTNVQARKVVWNESDGQHRRISDQAFPPELRVAKSEWYAHRCPLCWTRRNDSWGQ